MIALVPSPEVRTLTDAYKAEWAALGRAEADLPPLGISRQIVVADTNEKAQAIASRAFAPFTENLSYLWQKFDVAMPPGVAAGTFETRLHGPPLRRRPGRRPRLGRRARGDGRHQLLSLEFAFGDMTFAETLRSAELFATEVMPAFP